MNDESAAFCERMFCLATTVIKDFSHQLIAFVAFRACRIGQFDFTPTARSGTVKIPLNERYAGWRQGGTTISCGVDACVLAK